MPKIDLRKLSETVLLVFIGGCGGTLADLARLPMPYLLGGLVFTAAYAIFFGTLRNRNIAFPEVLRRIFMGVIGVMIGATFDEGLVHVIPALWQSLLAMIIFIVLVQRTGSWFYRRVGGYDPVTATFAAMPGGLIEAVALGQEAGGDAGILTVQHFVRISLIVIIVPVAIFFWSGKIVGSAAGQQLSATEGGLQDVVIILVLTGAGMAVGIFLRIPLPHLMGGLLLSAVLHIGGFLETSNPTWLLQTAQLFIGIGLGVTFSGVDVPVLLRAIRLGLVATLAGLFLSLIFAFLLSMTVPLKIDALLLSFTIGGVTEMGLIALSLGISPAAITVHHLFRIIMTILYARLLSRHNNEN